MNSDYREHRVMLSRRLLSTGATMLLHQPCDDSNIFPLSCWVKVVSWKATSKKDTTRRCNKVWPRFYQVCFVVFTVPQLSKIPRIVHPGTLIA